MLVFRRYRRRSQYSHIFHPGQSLLSHQDFHQNFDLYPQELSEFRLHRHHCQYNQDNHHHQCLGHPQHFCLHLDLDFRTWLKFHRSHHLGQVSQQYHHHRNHQILVSFRLRHVRRRDLLYLLHTDYRYRHRHHPHLLS